MSTGESTAREAHLNPGKTMSTTSDRLPAAVLPLDNRRIAGRLEEVADWLEAKHDNHFRVNAYRAAAETVRHLDRPVGDILRDEGTDGLEALPTIGRSLARTIETLARTGELHLLDRLRGESDPVGLLADVPGVGPELAKRIYEQLHIATLEELEIAAHDGRLATVPGVGPKRLRGIRDALAGRLSRRRRPPAAAGAARRGAAGRGAVGSGPALPRTSRGGPAAPDGAAALQPGGGGVAAGHAAAPQRPPLRGTVLEHRPGPRTRQDPRLGR